MAGTIGTKVVTQVGIIVRDIATSKRDFAAFFGVPEPDVIDGGDFEVTGTTVEGEPAPRANCQMASFQVGDSLQQELIQPNEHKSTWRDFLDEHGEGIHHLAFNVKDMDEKLTRLEGEGMRVLQRGKYGDASGQYAYVDATDKLKFILELLESF